MLRKSASTKTAATRYSWLIILTAIILTFLWFFGPASTASEVQPPTPRSSPDKALVPLVTISGRVLADNCRGIQNARVNLTDSNQNVQAVTTSTFGYFRFDGVTAPGSYSITVTSSRSQFLPRQLSATTDMANIDFVAGSSIGLCVNAGPDRPIVLPGGAQLNGVAISSNSVSTLWSKVSGPGIVNFDNPQNPAAAATFSVQGLYILRFSASDGTVSAFDDVQVTVDPVNVPPPPDPAAIAPPLSKTVATNISTSTKFLYTGPNAIQTGVDPDDIAPERVGLLRGKVKDKAGTPLANVLISVLDHPEFGQTRSRADGMFDMVVNAGGELTVKYEKANFIGVQREEKINWQTYSKSEDVVMIPLDPNVTEINLASSTPIQVASGSMSSDSAGQRRSRLFFKQGTQATIHLPNGSTQPISLMHVRSTEFTVGESGPEAMPAALPSNSEYTYAAEYTVDEAIAVNATNVSFSRPVIQYLENFIGFPVGADVPTGSYDRQTAEWKPEPSGKIVKILSISSGTANLDLIGNGQPATDQQYADRGIDLPERQKLAELYTVNQTLWRVPVDHFTPWDCNYPPANKPPPDVPAPFVNRKPKGDCEEEEGCKTKIKPQIVSETIEIISSPYEISYQTGLQRDYVPQNGALIPLVGPTPPDSDVENVGALITVAGKTFQSELMPPSANLSLNFSWDGNDYAGRRVQGPQKATVAIVHLHTLGYVQAPEFGQNGNGNGPTFVRTGAGSAIRNFEIEFGNFDQAEMGLGGWALDVHHVYSPVTQTLYEGNGSQRSARSSSSVVNTTSGNGTSGFGGDGGPASEARLFEPSDVAFAGDGTYYVADRLNSRIRKVTPNGIISTFAGDGSESCPGTSPCGDGGPAASAQLNDPEGVSVAPDGTVYLADTIRNRVRKVDTNGIITTVAGNGTDCQALDACGDGGPAIAASLNQPRYIHLARDGSLYIGDSLSHRVRKVSTNGNITTVAGSGNVGCASDNVPARTACIEKPTGVALSENGDLYITGNGQNDARIFRLDTDGRIHVLASGDACSKASPNVERPQGVAPALCSPRGITVGPDGDPYFAADNRIYKIDNDRDLIPVVGTLDNQYNGEGQPVTTAGFSLPAAAAFAPDGNIYVAAANNHRVRQVTPVFPGFTGDAVLIPSEDGTEVFEFDADGRHLRTLNSLTGTNKYVFAYNSMGDLTTITDGDNNVTTIERDGASNPTGIRSPYGQLTTFSLDPNGYIASITNPAGEANRYTYSAGGLMLTKRDPLGHLNTFTYDAEGRLVRNQNPDGATTFSHSGIATDYTVTHRSPMNRTSAFRVQTSQNDDEVGTSTFPDSRQQIETTRSDGSSSSIDPDGTRYESRLGPEPRWGMQAPIPIFSSAALPSGQTLVGEYTRTALLTTPSNPFSLIQETESFSVNNRTTTNVYTAANRTHVTLTPAGRQATYTIDNQERVVSRRFGNLAPVAFSYDARGRLATFTSGAGQAMRTFQYGYNAFGGLSTITDPLNGLRTLSYNPAGLVTRQTFPDNRFVDYTYDAEGNTTAITPPGRGAHLFSFNNRDLLTAYTPPPGSGSSQRTFAYNADRQLTRITRPDGGQINFSYEPSGNRSSMTIPGGTYTYAYLLSTGGLGSITSPGGVSMTFERDGPVLKSTTWAGPVSGNVSSTLNSSLKLATESVNQGQTVSFQYDDDGLITSAGNFSATRNSQSGLLTGTTVGSVNDTFAFNEFIELTGHTARFNSSVLFDESLSYNKLGNITQKIETINGQTTTYNYGYDATNRLTTVSLNGAPQPMITYSFDLNNNRASINVSGSVTNGTYDAQDRMTQFGNRLYSYSADGELQSKTVASSTTQYSYDAIGNLRNVTLPGGTAIEYVIDGHNRRIGKKVNGSLTRGFLYGDTLTLLAELDQNGAVASRFVYGTRANVPEYMAKGGVIYRIVTDYQGSVRLVVDSATGNIAQRLAYDEFGVVLEDTNPGFQPFGFAGGLYDPQTRLTRFGARDYDAESGRWTTKDPTLFAATVSNLYEYCDSDPINLVDLNGLGGSSPTTNGVAGNKKSLVGDAIRAVKKNNDLHGNLPGELREQADKLLEEIIKFRKRILEITKRLAVLRERAFRCYRDKKKVPPQLLLETLKLTRELSNLQELEFRWRQEYIGIAGIQAANMIAEPLAKSVDVALTIIDPSFYLNYVYSTLTGAK